MRNVSAGTCTQHIGSGFESAGQQADAVLSFYCAFTTHDCAFTTTLPRSRQNYRSAGCFPAPSPAAPSPTAPAATAAALASPPAGAPPAAHGALRQRWWWGLRKQCRQQDTHKQQTLLSVL